MPTIAGLTLYPVKSCGGIALEAARLGPRGLEAHGIKAKGVSLDLDAMMDRKDGVVEDLTKGIEYLLRKQGRWSRAVRLEA